MFIGRKKELQWLSDAYHSDKGELVVIYGRRRIGKSSLVNQFAQDKPHFYGFEAIEGQNTAKQIAHFTDSLKKQVSHPILNSVQFQSWETVFAYITDHLIKANTDPEKTILFFDELQWMAAGRGKLVSYIKYYWDKHWKDKGVMLILCGSVASFMVKRVLSSNALYGRATLEILLKGLPANEAAGMFKNKRSQEEILKYLLIFGGVPKYLEMIDPNRSFNQNMNRLCFSPQGLLVQEVERLFYSQFREVQTYKKIAILLKSGIYSLEEIAAALHMPSGGGLKLYLENLERAEIIRSYIPFGKGPKSKFKKYALADEYLHFYFKYIEPNRLMLNESMSERLFETFTGDSLSIWLGFAFERFCFKNAGLLALRMGFKEQVLLVSPLFGKRDQKFWIDLLFLRADKVITVCEIKHLQEPVGKEVIPAMERRLALVEVPVGYSLEKALISLHGPDEALKKSDYFNHHVTLKDLLE